MSRKPESSHKPNQENNEEIEARRRAEVERKNIVRKYTEKCARDDDSWVLDASAKIYRVTDRYGFLHENEEDAGRGGLWEEEERRKQMEVKRQDKWLKMVQKWPKYIGTDKLAKRVYKGIPLRLRGDVWRLLLQVDKYIEDNNKVYENMKRIAVNSSPDVRQIDLDVHRTYRDHIMFRERYSVKQQQLFHVLVAYSMYNTEVGYCQGMSQIAALLLMFMSEEEAFWALHSLLYCEKHSMHGFFIPGFPKLLRFQDHHDKILTKFTPRLKKHLDKNEIYASLYTMKWFFQCFLDRSPFPLTLRLWDIYVLEGERLLTAMSYTTLKMHKAHIKKLDMEEIVAFLQENLASDFGSDNDHVVDHLKSCMMELSKFGMDRPPPPANHNEEPKKEFGVCLDDDTSGELPEGNNDPSHGEEGDNATTTATAKSGGADVSQSFDTSVASDDEQAEKAPEKTEPPAPKDQQDQKKDVLRKKKREVDGKRRRGSRDHLLLDSRRDHPAPPRRDVIRWKKVSGNFSGFTDHHQHHQVVVDDDADDVIGGRHGDHVTSSRRPASLYDNVVDLDHVTQNGIPPPQQAKEDVFEMNFQAAIEEVGISRLPPPSPVVTSQYNHRNPHNLAPLEAPYHHHKNNRKLAQWSETPLDVGRKARSAGNQQQLHRFPVATADAGTTTTSRRNHNTNNNNSRSYQTENPRRAKRSTENKQRKRHSQDCRQVSMATTTPTKGNRR